MLLSCLYGHGKHFAGRITTRVEVEVAHAVLHCCNSPDDCELASSLLRSFGRFGSEGDGRR